MSLPRIPRTEWSKKQNGEIHTNSSIRHRTEQNRTAPCSAPASFLRGGSCQCHSLHPQRFSEGGSRAEGAARSTSGVAAHCPHTIIHHALHTSSGSAAVDAEAEPTAAVRRRHLSQLPPVNGCQAAGGAVPCLKLTVAAAFPAAVHPPPAGRPAAGANCRTGLPCSQLSSALLEHNCLGAAPCFCSSVTAPSNSVTWERRGGL